MLESDAILPSVSSLVAGEPVRGSWWGHRRGQDIFRVSMELADHPDVTSAKLISGKVTWVHRALWPPLLGVAGSREPWQMKDLSSVAQSLLSRVKDEGLVRTDQIEITRATRFKVWADAARELERKLLVRAESVHTESGKHVKCLESWDHWARRLKLTERKMRPEQGKAKLEEVVRTLNARYGAKGRLPWAGA